MRLVLIQLLASALAVVGCRTPALRSPDTPPTDTIIVLQSSLDPALVQALDCPEGRCTRVDLEHLSCRGDEAPAAVVIVTGHSAPPDEYLHGSAARLSASIACYRPALVVLDTCYGFSSPLLEALAAKGLTPVVVGPTYELPPAGLLYDAPFFADLPPSARARFVRSRSGLPLSRFHLDARCLRAALDDVAAWPVARLTAHLRRILPNLVEVPIPGSTAVMLVPMEPERFRQHP